MVIIWISFGYHLVKVRNMPEGGSNTGEYNNK